MKISRIIIAIVLSILLVLSVVYPALAFCGFYVSGADSKLFNKASQVIIARKGDNTVLTMANDFQGAVKDFAVVIPVPVAIKKEQVNVGKRVIVEKLDAFTQPRLVEYFDRNPCMDSAEYDRRSGTAGRLPRQAIRARDGGAEGVTIEDSFKVNEYEILILSARESDGLESWLKQRGYKLPDGASELLEPYIRQGMKFFVAKVDVKEFESQGFQVLRPLQIAYTSPKFMLPIRLGMTNANGDQDLIAYILSPEGRVELANYRTVKIPTDANIPEYVKEGFGDFYKSVFQRSYEKENGRVGFLEYAWDVSNCDPCSTEPPTEEELKEAGVFWRGNDTRFAPIIPPNSRRRRPVPPSSENTFVTRLHIRYNRSKFPEDLVFQQTANRETFQGRYIMNHPFTGTIDCSAGGEYRRNLRTRLATQVTDTANLTGWNPNDIRSKINFSIADDPIPPRRWRGNLDR
jgi:hypothetical protein